MAYNTGQGVQGAVAGGMAGSSGGAWGAGLGALMGLLSGFGGGGKEGGLEKFDTMSPEQQNILQQLMQQLGGGGQLNQAYGQSLSGMQEMMDPSSAAYQRFEQPYLQQFDQETIPGIAERFAGQGAQGGALSSSGFGQSLSSAGSNLQSQLAGMKSGLQQQAMRDIMGHYSGMLGQGLGAKPFGYQNKAGEQGMGSSMLQGYAGAGFPGMEQGFKSFGNWMKG